MAIGEPIAAADRPGYEVVRVRTWTEFQELLRLGRYKSWAFRGQSDASWSLASSLSRYFVSFGVHPDAWSLQEWRIIRIFRRKAHLFLDNVPAEDDIFQWLALMKHHGAPTRLLDFTWSPFVAAFFALEGATREAAVWALCVPRLRKAPEHLPEEYRGTVATRPMREAGSFQRLYLNATVPFVGVGEPYVMNRRLVAQSGTFVTPSVVAQPVEAILATYPDSRSLLTKVVLETENLRDEAMEALYAMNVTPATLFPDLDGLARSMAFELEFHWAFNPKTMDEYTGFEGYVDKRKGTD